MIKKYKVIKDCFCEYYLHELLNYPRSGLKELKLCKDDEVELIKEWSNFYGYYLRVKKNDEIYDINPSNLKLIQI